VRTIAALVLLVSTVATQERAVREIAITFDDLPVVSVTDREGAGWSKITDDLLAALVRNRVPAVGFVNEQKLERAGELEPARLALLQRWLAAGMELGNHSYSHLDFHSADIEIFQRDVMRGERHIRGLMEGAGKKLRFFRHPYLHTGRSPEARRALDAFLAERGYQVAPVTIDNYDYVFAAAYERAGEERVRREIADAYIPYLSSVVSYYERQSILILEREIPQVLLLHANALNAAVFDRIAAMLRERGYSFVPLDRALADPAYRLRDTYVGPAGITWLHRWALSQGKRGAIFAGEPRVPEWVEQAALPRTKG
jgi:peptidoglycan/xylan/chitin deacetylase (PgdA/CDA1 family)